MKILILFSTKDGHTRKIAEYLAEKLAELGKGAEVVNLHTAGKIDWEKYDKVVLGASIRYGYYRAEVHKFVKKYIAQLTAIPSAFYSVNLVARKPEKRTPETNAYAQKFLTKSPWRPDHSEVIAGALLYPRYSWYDRFLIKLIMKQTGGEIDTSKEYIYTDWEQVSKFAKTIAQLSKTS